MRTGAPTLGQHNDEILDEVGVSEAERRRFEAGQSIVAKDAVGGGLFVIMSGSAELHAGGKRHTLGPGQFFGEMALLSGKPRSATVTAQEPVEAMVIEAMYFRPFLIKNPSVAVTILEGVVDRLREVQDRIDPARSPGATAPS